ncbi:MAG TPA: tetratricopeptide repeat protein [Candidatus Acidoferrum sp.]|jgi:TPR repeat protein|nr:tetratricopeptide repeat protein [Candidatus Acidoferrum sp.]
MKVKTDDIKPKPLLPLLLVLFVVVWCGAFVYFRAPLETRAARGNAEPQYQFAKCYFYGIGLSRNYVEAARWFRLAADQGHAKAQTALGMMYVQGLGMPRNYSTALSLFRKAATQGLDAAQNQLGMLYAQGRGVPQDFDEATKWFSRAAGQGCEPAVRNLKLIAATRPSYLPQLTMRDGKAYQNVKIQKVELDGLTISYHPRQGGMGIAKLGFKDLPEQLQEKYGYTDGKITQLASSAQLAVVVLQTL